ncbi:MAG: acyl carrier protein [Verrucomicrobia bacterium]|nr:acyl carrier protein [Verrucomicrobiota bacterium]
MNDNEYQQTARRLVGLLNRTLATNIEMDDLSGVKRLDELVGFDSMTSLQWVAALEEEFQLRVPPDKLRLDFLTDLAALVDFVSQAERSGAKDGLA